MPNIKITRLYGEYVLQHIEGERHAEVQDITMMPLAYVYYDPEGNPFQIMWLTVGFWGKAKEKLEAKIFS